MPRGLRRFHESPHIITFVCYRRQPNFVNAAVYDLFPLCLEDMRRCFDMRVYGYVLMPEHVHVLRSQRPASAQVSVQKKDANLGHQAEEAGLSRAPRNAR